MRPGVFVVLLALGAVAAPAAAQSDAIVHGQVLAATDRSALPGATVTLRAGTGLDPREVTTDAEGRFVFAQVPPDDYVVSVAIDGFEPRQIRLAVEPREVRTLSLALDAAHVRVNVEVTAEVRALPATHSPSSTMVTKESLEWMPAFARSTLPDAIVTSAPGMIRGHDDFVHVRGEEIALNPILDGVAFWENPHAMFSAGLDPAIVDAANVMTGAFPAEYGSRFGGVVDIATRSGLRMQERGSAAFSLGDERRQQAAIDLGGRRRSFGYFLSTAALTSDRFLGAPDRRAVHDTGSARHAFGRFDWSAANVGALHGMIMGDAIETQIPKTPQDAELRPTAAARQEARQQTLTLGWTRAWSASVGNATFYERWSRVRLFPADGPLTAHAADTRELQTLGAKTDIARISGRHTVKVGIDAVTLRPREDLEYEYAGYRDLTHVLGLPHLHFSSARVSVHGRDRGGQVSAFAQDNVQLGTRVTADLGLRVDRYALVSTAAHVSPRINVAYRAAHAAVLHASYNHLFAPPPIEGVLSSSAGLTSQLREIGVALPPLPPAIEDQFELGAALSAGPLRLGVTGYYRATDNPVHTTVWPDARIYTYASFDRGRAYGLEATTEVTGLARLGLSGRMNYALGRVQFKNPVTAGFVLDPDHLQEANWFAAPMDQRHTLTGATTYRHARSGLWAALSIEYGSGTPIGHGDAHEHADGAAGHTGGVAEGSSLRVPGHVTADATAAVDLLRAAARRPRLTLRVDVQNVANRVFLVARDSEFSPGQYSIPRQLSLTARVQF